jgi:hypothetical protein
MKGKGFPHEYVVRWHALERYYLRNVKWPDEIIEEFGDLEERVLGQKIFESGKVRLSWTNSANILSEGIADKVSLPFDVPSISKKIADYYPITVTLIRRKESGNYKITGTSDCGCKDMQFHRKMGKRPRMPGPDQHAIAAMLAAQQEKNVEQKYGMFPDDYVNLCDKLDVYFQGDFTSVFRRLIKYVVNAACAGSEEVLDQFEGSPPAIVLPFKQKKEYSVKIVAMPKNKGTVLEVHYGKRNQVAEVYSGIPHSRFIRPAPM